ncbi:codanin-1-like [Saccoglossus kowalevskii]
MLVLLGWLFEIPVFPEGFFFKVYDDCFMKDSVLPITTTTAASNSLSLDSMDLIDQHFLYLCCPFLSELRVLLLESAVGMRSQGGMYKKITPIAADKITEDNSTAKKSAFTLVEKQLQSKLIENFYHNQPESVKKIIDFVCERVVSNCKTQILTRLLVGIFQTELKEISNIIKEDLSTEEEPDTAKIKKKLFGKIQIACVNAQATVASQGKRYCQNKCLKCIKLLLPENTKGEVVKVSSNIASQLTYEKIYQWIQHDFTAKLNKNLSVEVEQLLMDDKVLAYRETNKEHKDSKDETCVPTSTSLILQLKELLSKMRCCETNNKFVLKEMDSLLQTVSLIYLSRKVTPYLYHLQIAAISI